jgi:acetyl/propionyl-CoA carboxylase alpha subunit
MKDSRSILLLLVSFCLIGTWVYHIYDKSKYAAVQPTQPSKIDSTESTTQLGDSVTQLYQSAVVQLEDAKTGRDSLNRQLQDKVNEIDTLRIEINRMLGETNLTREDLKKALAKIQNLQQKINQLYQSNTSVATAPGSQSTGGNIVTQQRTNPGKQSAQAAVDVQLQATDIAFQAIKKPADEVTDVDGDNPEQIAVSFQLKNPSNNEGSASIYVILKDPAGNIVQDDQWMAGMFQSKTDGYIKYSRKLNWDYSKGDAKRLNATIPVNKISKGGYQLQLYQNGLRIGKADWVIN